MLILAGALLVSFIFPIALYLFLRSAHKGDEEYKKDCSRLLLHGLLLGFPVFGFSLLCNIVFRITHISDAFPFAETVFKAFILHAFSEELMKYLLARKTIRKNHSRVSFLDLMSFTAISAIGFELMEAVIYFFSTNIPQILVRGITNMHAAFGLTTGFILAKKYKKNPKASAAVAVLVPTLFHGVYDLCLDDALVERWGGLSLLIAILCLILTITVYFFMAKARKKEYYTQPLFPEAE